MSVPLSQHRVEIERNRRAWEGKPLLRTIYAGFYARLLGWVDPAIPGRTIEVGSGIGNLRAHCPPALATDLFANPWLDLVCDAYELPFAQGAVSHLVLFDVFHHLEAPNAFLREANRVLAPGGRLLLFEPYLSATSWAAYGLAHHEPVAWGQPIRTTATLPRPRAYYAAQGNATRLFFRGEWPGWPEGWRVVHREAFASFAYLLSGGFSRPAFYPAATLGLWQRLDCLLSRWPRCFGGRCLVVLARA